MSTELTTTKNRSIRGLLTGDDFKNQVALALPRHLKPDRFIRVALTALTRTPKLQQCTPESFFKCLLDLSAMGLEPDGRRAHLIPYGNECTLIVDYKGKAELVLRSGEVSTIHADTVRENDVFEEDLGRILCHKIDRRKPRGEMFAAYVHVVMKDGTVKDEVMSKDEIEALRDRSQGYRAALKYGKDNPWTTDPGEMWKKTVFHRCSKWLPLSPELREVLELDDDLPSLVNVTPTAHGSPSDGLLSAISTEPEPEPEAESPPAATDEASSKKKGSSKPKPEKKEAPAEPPAEDPTPSAPPVDRDALISKIKETMLDNGISESKAFGIAQKASLVPDGVDELFALPTASLDALLPLLKG